MTPRLALAAALTPAAALGSSVPAPGAPTDDQVSAAVAAVEKLLAQNRAAEALSVIRPVAQARPDIDQAVFSMGLAALATADASVRMGLKPKSPQVKENYDLAVHSFRGMLVRHPNVLRVRLELARALFQRGNCVRPPGNLVRHLLGDDCWAAEQHFLRVLGSDVPPQVGLNIRRFVQICRARKRASGSVSLALAPDTNVNTATSAQTIDIFGLPFQLNDEARATSGIGLVSAVGAEVQHPLPKLKLLPGSISRLRVGGNVYRRDYSGGDFDDSNFSMYAGPRFLGQKSDFSVLFEADRRSVNGRPYSRQIALRIEGVRLVVPRVWAGGSVEGARQTALSTMGPIGNAGLSWNAQSFINYTIMPVLRVRFMGGLGRENTDRFSTRHRSRWVGIMTTYDLPFGFTMTAAQQVFQTNFEQRATLFGGEKPETKLWFSRLALHNRALRFKGFSPSLSLIREDRRANVSLYRYQRYRVEAGVVRVF